VCKKTKTFTKTVILALTLFVIIASTPTAAYAQTYNWKLNPQIKFKLPAYNTVIAFADYVYLDSFSWDSFNASAVTFNNIQIEGDDAPLSSFGLGVQNANATINHVNVNGKAEIVLSASTGTTSILTVYYPTGYPPTVDAVIGTSTETIQDSEYFRDLTDWNEQPSPAVYLDENSNLIKVKAKHASDVTVHIYWSGETADEGETPPGETTPPPDEGETSPPDEGETSPEPQPDFPTFPPPAPMPDSTLISLGVVVIVFIVVGVFAYREIEYRNDVKSGWKKRQKQAKKSVKWRKSKRFG